MLSGSLKFLFFGLLNKNMNVNNTIDQLAPSGLAYWLFLFFSYY